MKLLLIGDERKTRRMSSWGVGAEPYQTKFASSRAAVETLITDERFHVACIDWRMQQDDAAGIAGMVHERLPDLPLVAVIGESERSFGPRLSALGVSAFIVSPFPIDDLHALLRAHALSEPAKAPKSPVFSYPMKTDALRHLILQDEAARRSLEVALRAATSNAAILILGETGTGKSVLAQVIHQHSALRERPFVTVNCPCLNRELFESELFGHVRGAFTGAVQDAQGKVAAADGGTLFLDEIGELPMALQPKLLRLLQEKQYERVGEAASRTANVRIIAATNRDLKSEVAAGRFREDLYYRLNVIAIDVPPLRGRPAQIRGAADTFLARICAQLGKLDPGFTPEARGILEAYAWPGNLRELNNVIERAAILSSGSVMTAADFQMLLTPSGQMPYQIGGAISLKVLESVHIQMVVANSASLEEAARILEIDKSTLYRKRKQMESLLAHFIAPREPAAIHAVATGS